MKYIYSYIILNLLVISSFAQSENILKADNYYRIYAFNKAIDYYSDSEMDSLDIPSLRKLAESYKNTSQFIDAERCYNKLLLSSETNANDYYNYVLVLQSNQKYKEAEQWMLKMKEKYPTDMRVQKFFAEGNAKMDINQNNPFYSIANLDINSEESDFGTAYYKKQVVFASSRKPSQIINRSYNWNEKAFLDIYVANLTKTNQLVDPEYWNKEINQKWHEGPACFTKNGKIMAFTRNNYIEKSSKNIVNLQIFTSEMKGKEWLEPQAFPLNNPEYSVGHPTFNNEGTVMYFVSDMPGGMGGSDIYYVSKLPNAKWSEAINMGPKINTEGNEMFPYFDENSGLLFFASNGHKGLGGLDVYLALNTPNGFDSIQNLGAPINSPADDFAFIIESKLQTGFFSSNREGGKGDDDIYKFTFTGKYPHYTPPVKCYDIQLLIANKYNGKGIPKSTVTIDNQTIEADSSGRASFQLCSNNSLYAQINALGFITIEKTLTVNDTIVKDTILLLMDTENSIVLNNIYYDLDKWNILPAAALELDRLVAFMKNNPTIKIELSSHTDSRGSDGYNKRLSEHRAKSAVEYVISKGIAADRITAKGYGETRLINKCSNGKECSEEDHQMNRRTEITIIK